MYLCPPDKARCKIGGTVGQMPLSESEFCPSLTLSDHKLLRENVRDQANGRSTLPTSQVSTTFRMAGRPLSALALATSTT
jgi:hypothetical protein